MEGVSEEGLRIFGVEVADQRPCCNKMYMLQAKVVEERGYVLRRMFSECDKKESCGNDRSVFSGTYDNLARG